MSRQPKWSSFSGFLKSSSENVTRTRQERKKPVTKSSKKSNATKTKRLSSDRLGFTPVITPIHSPPYSQDDFKRDEEADERPANRPSPRSPTSPSSNKDRYEITDYIGGGSYGCVFSAIDTKDGHEVAVKTQSNFSKRKKNVVMLLREVRCLRLLRGHPCVVELYDVMVPDDLATFDELSFVFEKADTTLRSVLKSDQFFAPVHVQTIMYQILCGLKFIHSASIVHRDIKPENILINTNVTVKICDLGMARGIEELMPNLEDRVSMSSRPSVSDVTPTLTTPTTPLLTPSSYATPSHHRNLSTSSLSSASRTPGGRSPWKRTPRSITRHVVTRWYRPPEVLLFDQQMGEVLKAIDIWSAGCVMGELLQMLPENCSDYRERAAIFPGSGSTLSAEAFQPDDSADGDQLKQIFAILGSPTRSDQAAIQSDKALRILSFLGETEGTGLDRMFPGSSGASMSLMKSLLRINPYDRMTANDAVQLQYFDPIRKSLGSRDEFEQRTLPAMGFEFERPMAEIRMSELREKLVDEIAYFHREIKEHWTPPENSAHRYEGRRRRRFSVGRKSDLI